MRHSGQIYLNRDNLRRPVGKKVGKMVMKAPTEPVEEFRQVFLYTARIEQVCDSIER
jgi:hypothetical protein